jgi:hypothetical protein
MTAFAKSRRRGGWIMNDKRMTDQERKHVKRLTFKFQAWEAWRHLRGVALGIFLIWVGLTAIDRGENYLLGLYVVVASIALGVLMAKVWGDD